MRSDHRGAAAERSHERPPAFDGSGSSMVSNWWTSTPASERLSNLPARRCPPSRNRELMRSTTTCAAVSGVGGGCGDGAAGVGDQGCGEVGC
eukprot:3560-Prymnesium_polylepis.1